MRSGTPTVPFRRPRSRSASCRATPSTRYCGWRKSTTCSKTRNAPPTSGSGPAACTSSSTRCSGGRRRGPTISASTKRSAPWRRWHRTRATAWPAASSRPSAPGASSTVSWPTTCGAAGGSERCRQNTRATTPTPIIAGRSGPTTTRPSRVGFGGPAGTWRPNGWRKGSSPPPSASTPTGYPNSSAVCRGMPAPSPCRTWGRMSRRPGRRPRCSAWSRSSAGSIPSGEPGPCMSTPISPTGCRR